MKKRENLPSIAIGYRDELFITGQFRTKFAQRELVHLKFYPISLEAVAPYGSHAVTCGLEMSNGERSMNTELGCNVRTLRRTAGPASSADGRMRANWRAEFRSNGSRIPCTVMDVSSGGACLALDGVSDRQSSLWLIIDKMAPIPASVVWRKRNHAGVRFRKEQQWVLEACKQRFDPTAWMKS